MPDSEQDETMVTMKVPMKVHASIKLMKKRYGTRKIADSLWEFILEYDPKLAEAGEKIANLQKEIAGFEIDDDDDDE